MFREKTSCTQGGGCRSPTSKRVGPSDFFCAKYPNLFSTPRDPKKIAWVNSLCGLLSKSLAATGSELCPEVATRALAYQVSYQRRVVNSGTREE